MRLHQSQVCAIYVLILTLIFTISNLSNSLFVIIPMYSGVLFFYNFNHSTSYYHVSHTKSSLFLIHTVVLVLEIVHTVETSLEGHRNLRQTKWEISSNFCGLLRM